MSWTLDIKIEKSLAINQSDNSRCLFFYIFLVDLPLFGRFSTVPDPMTYILQPPGWKGML